MRVIVHLSDLHFGRLDPRLVTPLVRTIRSLDPHLVAISGDFTQRARPAEFVQARDFLEQLPFPLLAVPGNHDVPLYNLPRRFLNPFQDYRRFVAEELEPTYQDAEMVAIGLNSARSLPFHGGGRLNERQATQAAKRLEGYPADALRIVVTHHPFDLPNGFDDKHLVGRSALAMQHLAAAHADLFLAGHLHVSHVGHTASRYGIAGHSALVVQAGTLSTRQRGEANTINVVRWISPTVVIERHSFDAASERFQPSWRATFRKAAQEWSAVAAGH